MARNKYPEETVRKILDIAYRLFREKGYDHTTIQDIVDALGMSKGAVYHHFKSKEEILDCINKEYYNDIQWFKEIRLDDSLTGLEKLKKILKNQFTDHRKRDIDTIHVSLENNPRLVAQTLAITLQDATPFFQQLVEEGVRDGSITVRQPKECAEALLLLLNLWVGICTADREDFVCKMNFIQDFTGQMGMALFDEEVRKACMDYFECVMQ